MRRSKLRFRHSIHEFLWEFWIFIKVWFTLFQERFATLPAPHHGVIEHGSIAGKLLNASLPIKFGIESSLHHSESERRTLHHRLRPLNTLILQLVERDDFVHQTHALSFPSRVLATKEPYLTGLLLSDDSCEIGSSEASIERSDLRSVCPKMAFSDAIDKSHIT